ncbi:tripartite tricarboxylate transporter TctB family protein [Advenella mimigardefordensis]|uniref:tripartite tricarboxylate transporter TctB family protein n=1 Tax=Advenella mimigardefordensis TaxID=302406 RepID=UPI00046CD947|nr:tripartite tricarboxylate transporter TctB family protein [Advenella mimigardefordensis]
MKLKYLELIFAVMVFVLGLYVLSTSISYGLTAETGMGTGFFPFISGLIFTISAAGIILRQLRNTCVPDGKIGSSEVQTVLLMVVATAIFLLIVEIVGFLILTPFYIFSMASIIKRPTQMKTLMSHFFVAGGFTLFAYGIFVVLLETPIPGGWFFPEN